MRRGYFLVSVVVYFPLSSGYLTSRQATAPFSHPSLLTRVGASILTQLHLAGNSGSDYISL